LPLPDSEEIGGYSDPHYIDGYTYNPNDGKWYKSPPAPDYGQWAWLLPASSEKNATLDARRIDNIKHNSLEELWLDYGDKKMDSEINTNFQSAQNFIQRINPSVLDLGGDDIKMGTDWFSGDDGFLVPEGSEQIHLSISDMMLESQVQGLVDAMAGFSAQSALDAAFSLMECEQLDTLITTNCQ